MRLRVENAPRARREMKRKAASWAKHSTSNPHLFWQEFLAAVRRLSVEPYAGRRWISRKGKVYWRLLLPQTENHIYYSYLVEQRLIRVLSVWGARRKNEPRL